MAESYMYNNENSGKTRSFYIDVMRGMGICLVIFAHIYQNFATNIDQFICTFHMPLFFWISGFLYDQKQNIKVFIGKAVLSDIRLC